MIKLDKYNIDLEFDFKNVSYKGRETITGIFDETIRLDSNVEKILDVRLDGKHANYKMENGILEIVGQGKEIFIEFENKVSEVSLMGIYKSITSDGYIITTQMEPTGARYFIPCFDHPAMKAVFQLKVSVNDPSVEVIFNTDAISDKVSNGQKIIEFRETPRMSTYLIYLGIGHFERISAEHKGRTFSVITEPGKSKYGEYALNILKELVDAYEEYYEIPYPLRKLDLISVSQFAAGAMENWGAITFRESLLLKTEKTSFNLEKTIAKVISHELAHQWFGDLVTMNWWEDLWLNESFATFMGDKMVKKIRPDWKVDEEFIIESLYPSMELDSLTTTHPITVNVRNPDEIAEIFDSISYGKGGSILRMIENYMGEEEFRKGIVNYLNKYSYSNASAKDLWNSLQEVSGKNISGIMSKWISKEGHPLIIVEKIPSGYKLTQNRFTYLNKEDDYVWPIPMKVLSGRKEMEFLFEDKKLISLMELSEIDPDVKGYYRVLYEEKDLEMILKRKRLSYQEGLWLSKVLDDYFAFSLAGRFGFNKFMDMLKDISNFKNYVLILRILDIQGELLSLMDDERISNISAQYSREILSYISKSRDPNNKILRERASARLAQLDHQFRMKLLQNGLDKINKNDRLAYFISLAKEGELDKLKQLIWEHKDEQDTVRGIQAFTMVESPDDLYNFLQELKGRLDLRANLVYAVMGATRNKKFRDAIWKWIDENYSLMREFFAGSGYLSFMVESLISYSAIGHRKELDEFLGKIKVSEVKRGIDNGMEWLRIHESLISEMAKMHN